MVVYSYLIKHDFGLAPNPFGEYCTLAVCKPKIRKSNNLKIGDWVIGTGSKALEKTTRRILVNKLIYAMEVCEVITLQDYWNDARFQYKKPIFNGSLVYMYGDNFYHKDKKGDWVQEDSAHCNLDEANNKKHLKKDTGGKNVLIAKHFYYFGDKAISIPSSIVDICHTGIGHKKVADRKAIECVNWIKSNFDTGIHGDPLNWIEHKQLEFRF